MASTSEIRRRIGSVRQTQKITHAMYLIASQAKLRKAKQELDNTRPYFRGAADGDRAACSERPTAPSRAAI